MGITEGGTPTRSEKASSPAQEHSAIPAYPDWTAFQAYYPGVGMPPPYFGSAVASGHPPHPYLWGPQPLLPPYGSPAYAALYSHGGMYAHHPSMALGAHPHGHVVSTPATNEATGASTETPSKSSNSKDQGLVKKLKGFGGLAVSIGNGNVDASGGQTHGQSQSSGDSGSEGSSEGSDGNTGGRKRIAEELTLNGKTSNGDSKANGESHTSTSRPLAVAATPPASKTAECVSVSGMTPGMEFRNLTSPKSKAGTAAPGLQAAGVMVPAREGLPSELWLQDERELKRERRKQSNRESARRSRLRKQAETEELAMKVESLNSENLDLREELNRLREKSEKLKQENSSLMEKVKKAQMERAGGVSLDKVEAQPAGVENFLSRMSNASQVNRSGQRDDEGHENTGKLHQLLESNSRTDAVAAG
ncbi:G-box-binding factor 3 isoform X1 [Nymphaea colorata]|nr:G-box-binding factor 3 isoform X1 [Nymphaea colorata]